MSPAPHGSQGRRYLRKHARRARLQVTLSERERPEEVANPERLAANVQERLAKLTWNGSLSVSTTE